MQCSAETYETIYEEQAIRNKYGSDLTLIECTDVKLQLPGKDIVIGTDVRKALKNLTHDQQKYAMLGIGSFFGTIVTELQSELPLKNELLRQLGCLNQLKKNDGFTVSAVEKLASLLHPKLNTSKVVDEWKLFQVDNNIPRYNGDEGIEKFWNVVFDVLQHSGKKRYKLLSVIVKSALILGQTNAESEHSRSVNARVVTQDRSLLNEETIIGLRVVKEAV